MSEILSENELQMIEDLHRYSDTGQSRTIRHLIASHRALQAERDAVIAKLGCHPAYLFAELEQTIERAERTPNADEFLQLRSERDALKAELEKARRQTWQDAAEAYARYRQALIPQAGDWRKPEPFDEWCLRQAHGDIQP